MNISYDSTTGNHNIVTLQYDIGSHRELILDVSKLTSSQLEMIQKELANWESYSYFDKKSVSNNKKEHVYLIIPQDESTPVFPIEIFKSVFTL